MNDNNNFELEERVISLFHKSLEAKMSSGELLAPNLVAASQLLVTTLLNEHKILVAGNGISAANSQILVNCLGNRFERERPGFAAYALATNPTAITAFASDNSFNEIFSKQISALGQAGDVLVLLTTSGNPSNLIQAVASAHDRGMSVIAFTGRDGGNIPALLDIHDIELRAPIDSRARIHEVHLLSIFCLCDLVDHQLFGPLED
ncbi:SIS domain-containing protein [Halioxenophilus sp. WMMB6]|uniref:SIS domain-containing protein n=1 Tax=Halioxenophilus sp. WMMB6 TaxID=3073815 RepID=UPI00295EF359|nr:SIS domain-containing protein [Halioxenophilus sp. WMMB6]